MKALPAVLLLSAAALCGTAGAQTVYKCTLAGKVTYGDTPCASGKSVAMAAPDAPTPASAGGAAFARQKRLLDRLEKERRQEDAASNSEMKRSAKAAAQQRKKCASLKLEQKWAHEDAAAATGKDGAKTSQKARRAAEKLALECPA